LGFSKRVKWITKLCGGIPQQVLGSTSTWSIFVYGVIS